jgi:hypothetical protein
MFGHLMRTGGSDRRRSMAVTGRPTATARSCCMGPVRGTSWSGRSTCRSVVLSWLAARPARGGSFCPTVPSAPADSPSDDGGLLELAELAASRASSSQIRVWVSTRREWRQLTTKRPTRQARPAQRQVDGHNQTLRPDNLIPTQ